MDFNDNLSNLKDRNMIKGIQNIQLDLFNNALIHLEKNKNSLNLEKLKKSLKRKFSSQNINKIIFINQKTDKRNNKRYNQNNYSQISLKPFLKEEISINYWKRLKAFLDQNSNIDRKVQVSLFNKVVPETINTLQYRGNKSQVIDFLAPHFQGSNSVLDLMAGSQSVSLFLKPRVKVISNDVQYYSFVLGKAYIENNKYSKLKTIPKGLIRPDPDYKLFQEYFSGVYFTHEQCVEIDNIRATLDQIKRYDEVLFYCYLTCLLKSLDNVARTAGHFDGALNEDTEKAKKRRKKSIYDEFSKRVNEFKTVKSNLSHKCYNLPAEQLLRKIDDVDIIYIDPPYNHRQYSRYYHILETCAKYNDNINQDTKGLYPNDKFKSKFCYKSEVEQVFRNIIGLSMSRASKKVIISYTNVGLISRERLYNICKDYDPKAQLCEKDITYTRQKTSKNKKIEKELLFILETKKKNWKTKFLPNGKKTLVITSCSKSKNKTKKKIESKKRYTGQMFSMVKSFTEKYNYDLMILSAKHGLLKPKEKISYYEKKIKNQEDIIKLRKKVVPELETILKKNDFERVIVIMGKKYRQIIEKIIDNKFVILESNNGIFDYLSKLKKLNEKTENNL